MPWRENKGVCQFIRSHGLHDYLSSEFKRMLDGCFWLRERKKSFVEILF